MDFTVVVFTMDGCSHCSNLKTRLHDNELPFLEIEITQNEEIWNQVVSQTGHNLIPTVFIKYEETEDGPVYVPGRDYQSEDEIVEIITKYFEKEI
jgi:glutaredoxin